MYCKTLVPAVALVLASFATAPLSATTAESDTSNSRLERLIEFQAQALARFDAADLNQDGVLDRSEAGALSERLVTHFDRIDLNGDGVIQAEELGQFLREVGARRHLARIMARGLRMRFEALDADGDGHLTRAEIGDRMPRLLEHFDAIDVDQDGRINLADVRAFWKARRAAGSGDGKLGHWGG